MISVACVAAGGRISAWHKPAAASAPTTHNAPLWKCWWMMDKEIFSNARFVMFKTVSHTIRQIWEWVLLSDEEFQGQGIFPRHRWLISNPAATSTFTMSR
eukprot:TRINITY_DN40417_c0_g1_i2.p2 TRINITY_DN40417_c0_g1~~TRINITY_DN40417_c0_g1_i2.p2  ORF type:complete len:100 (+),score=5.74 TRINITY_DN40417_c0_g1_i2:64-363(+)